MSGIETQQQYVALLQRAGDPEPYEASETIFREGDPADRMYVVVSGAVSLASDGRQLETVGPGGLFGELALIDNEPRSASAIAETDCELVAIESRRFWFLVQGTPYFAQIVMRVMCERLRREST